MSISYFNPKRDDYTFDVVFSSHVIEHMHNPAILKEHMDLFLAEDGFLILTCPNGSMSRLFNDPEGWRKHWGSVHPNHISDEYLVELFKEYKGAVFEERLTEEMFSEWINSCEYPVASHFPATGNLVALFCKSKLKN